MGCLGLRARYRLPLRLWWRLLTRLYVCLPVGCHAIVLNLLLPPRLHGLTRYSDRML